MTVDLVYLRSFVRAELAIAGTLICAAGYGAPPSAAVAALARASKWATSLPAARALRQEVTETIADRWSPVGAMDRARHWRGAGMNASYQTILARAADDLDQVVDDLDLAARLAPDDERMAIAARALQAHEMAAALRGCAGVPAGADGIRGRQGAVVIDETADVQRLFERMLDAVNLADEAQAAASDLRNECRALAAGVPLLRRLIKQGAAHVDQ